MSYKNSVSKALVVVAVIIGILTFIFGLVLGNQAGGYGTLLWSAVLTYWFVGFAVALFFIALAEIIQQLTNLNMKFENTTEDTNSLKENGTFTELDSKISDNEEKDSNETPKTYKDYPEAWAWAIGFLLLIFFLIMIGNN